MNRKRILKLLLLTVFLPLFRTPAEETAERPHDPASKARVQTVRPERTTVVELSNTDINRFHCEAGDINDVYFSEEKGISVSTDKDNAWIKYLIREKRNAKGDPENDYVSVRTEFHITCDGEVFTLLAYPVDRPAQSIFLIRGEGDRIARNVSIYEDMALEERAIHLTHKAITDTLDDSYTVKSSAEQFSITLDDSSNVHIRKVRDIAVDGMGLVLREYSLSGTGKIMLDEKQLMHPLFGDNILALTLMPEDHVITVEKPGRLYVVTVDRGGI